MELLTQINSMDKREKNMQGYIIWDVTCKQQLGKNNLGESNVPEWFWFHFDKTIERFGHLCSEEDIEHIKLMGAFYWKIQPVYKQLVRQDEGSMTIIGNLERFWDL